MAFSDSTTLQGYFQTGDKPTQQQFEDFIQTALLAPRLDAGVTSGATNVFNLTVDSGVTALTAGQMFTAIAHQTNTSSCSSSINGTSPVQITKLGGTALGAGDIVAGQALDLYYNSVTSSLQLINPASVASSGTVTSVAATVPSGLLTISGSPITTSGTLGFGLTSQAANLVLAGPTSGGSTAPTFRLLTGADVAGIVPVQNMQTFGSSGNFPTPANTLSTTAFKFTIVGGGGGGGRSSGGGTSGGGGGGGAGATCIAVVTGLTASTNYSVTVGAGGISASSGGTSSVQIGATTYSATGGGGGSNTAVATPGFGGLGGASTNGTLNIAGGEGDSGGPASGSGGGGGVGSMGGGGAGGTAASSGDVGRAWGSGGGGDGSNANTGALGRQGIVTVEYVL